MRHPLFMLSAVSVLSIVGVALTAAEARAQDTGGAPPPEAAPPPAAPAQGAAPAQRDEEEDPGGRLRIGFNINGGLGTTTGLSGPVIGGTFRVGYQINRLLGIYGNFTPYVWVASSSLAGVSVSAAAGVQNSPMISVTPIDLLEIAAGPSIDYIGSASTTVAGAPGGGGGTSAGAGAYFGIHGRLALHLGGRNPETGRRKGFAIGADAHPSFVTGGAFTTLTLGLGADWY